MMSKKISNEAMQQAVLRSREHWNTVRLGGPDGKGQKAAKPRITIAISREYGAQGSSLARELAKRLHWPVYDRNILDRISDETETRAAIFRRVDECDPNWFSNAWEGVTGKVTVAEQYNEHLPRVLLSLAYHGNCIIVGRGACFVLPRETTLNIQCVAPLEARVARIVREEGFPADEVKRHIEEMDGARQHWIRAHFHKDPEYSHFYDLIFNTARLTVPACAEMAIRALADVSEALTNQ
ncbi:MAG: cytidylate kinase-like family protein [Planctomycetales bacterium]|nr:cytidylate kinase-like family protein [Planctomycetales bacterium]